MKRCQWSLSGVFAVSTYIISTISEDAHHISPPKLAEAMRQGAGNLAAAYEVVATFENPSVDSLEWCCGITVVELVVVMIVM